MKRDYNIGDIITIRGKQYEVRSQREFNGEASGYCLYCAFNDGMYCNLRSLYNHFLTDCSDKEAYFKRI